MVQVTRTYLRMHSLSQLLPAPQPRVEAELVECSPCSTKEWRELYSKIGHRWHWHDRDAWSDEQLAAHLADSNVRIFRVRALLQPPLEHAGFIELQRHADNSVEIVYLGIDERLFGHGVGAWLVTRALQEAFAMSPESVWLHTCTLDSPHALGNYLKRGLVEERSEVYEQSV